MKTKVLVFIVMTAMISIAGFAQENPKRFGFEISGGPSLATRELESGKLEKGLGIEAIFHYRFMPHTGVYAGWGWNKFSSRSSFVGLDADFEETGYVFGLQFKHSVYNSQASYYIRAGGLYNHIEIENDIDNTLTDTGHGFGFQLAGGVDLALGSGWSITPGVKFNALSRDAETENLSVNIDYHYLSVRMGFLKTF